MSDILNDENTYKKIKTDPTSKLQRQNNKLVDDWVKGNLISPNTANDLKLKNAQPPKMYGLPKLHKPGIPLRPIVSCVQSPFYKLSKYLKLTF